MSCRFYSLTDVPHYCCLQGQLRDHHHVFRPSGNLSMITTKTKTLNKMKIRIHRLKGKLVICFVKNQAGVLHFVFIFMMS